MKNGRPWLSLLLGVLLINTDEHPQKYTGTDRGVDTIAAVTPRAGGQIVRGRPRKDGTITGAPNANPTINGGQVKGRR